MAPLAPGKSLLVVSNPRPLPLHLLGNSLEPVGLGQAVAGHSVLRAFMQGGDGGGTSAGAKTVLTL